MAAAVRARREVRPPTPTGSPTCDHLTVARTPAGRARDHLTGASPGAARDYLTGGSTPRGAARVPTRAGRAARDLKERGWFDIPVVYNNRRAILAMDALITMLGSAPCRLAAPHEPERPRMIS
jgi:hypothetical protein